MPNSGWVTVRGIVRFRIDENTVYEERATLWRTSSLDEAIVLAEAESREYAEATDGVDSGFFQAYLLADAPEHGSEVFSLMRVSQEETDAYITRFFDTGLERSG